MNSNKEFIKKLRDQKLKAGKENLKTIAGAIDRLQKAFPRYGSFLMEFIQNSDDAKSTKISIKLVKNRIEILNNGLPFTSKDVLSICDIAGSYKSPEDHIGYLGIGFKSVFLVSNSPKIFSGNFKFKFDKESSHTSENNRIPWQIIPYWIEEDISIPEEYNTLFTFSIKNQELVNQIRDELSPNHINERILIFLRNINEIEIKDFDNNLTRIIKKIKVQKNEDYSIEQINHSINDKSDKSKWLIFRRIVDVPYTVKKDYITIEWERNNVNKREILAAFELSEKNKLKSTLKGTAHIGVFSFLPLKEIESGLKFLIHADFLTTPGRGELARDCKWNEWLAESLGNMILQKCIPIFKDHDEWKFSYSKILSDNTGGHEIFKKYITIPLNNFFQENLLLVTIDGSLEKPENTIFIKEPIRKLYDNDDLNKLFPRKKLIHPYCEFPSNNKIEIVNSDLQTFLFSKNFQDLVNKKGLECDVKWFVQLYKLILDTYNFEFFKNKYSRYNVEHDYFWNRLKNLSNPIILTENSRVAKITDCFSNPENLSIPESLINKPNIVHKDLMKTDVFKEFLYKLNEDRRYEPKPTTKVVQALTDFELRNRIIKEELENLNPEKWNKYSDHERISRTKIIKHLYITNKISLEEIKPFISLKSKTNLWLKPSQLLLSKTFQPKHNLELLIKIKLFDDVLEFVSPEYLESDDFTEKKEWRDFFTTLGVDGILSSENKVENKKSKIVEKIGINLALAYEKKKNRIPKERRESDLYLGWDIDSSGRKIEVKSTSVTSGYDLLLSQNEQKALFTENNYYIYVVMNALDAPTLSVISGKKLIESRDKEGIRFNYTYKAWNETTGAKIDEFDIFSL